MALSYKDNSSLVAFFSMAIKVAASILDLRNNGKPVAKIFFGDSE
jgi:hypothetical protein